METARLVSKVTGVSVIADPRLAELNTGQLAGMKREEAARQYPPLPGGMRAYLPLPGGESQLDQARRVGEFYLQILEEHGDRKVCVVAHGGTINALLRLVYGLPVNQPRTGAVPRFRMGDTAMSRIEINGPLDLLTHYVNDWSHVHEI